MRRVCKQSDDEHERVGSANVHGIWQHHVTSTTNNNGEGAMSISQRATSSRVLLLVTCLLGVSHAGFAQGLEEVVVTASRDEGAGLPGTFLRKTGDFLLLQVNVRNDTREAAA